MAFSSSQLAVLQKAGRAISDEMDRRGIPGPSLDDSDADQQAELFEVLAVGLAALSPRDVCLFKGDWEERNRAMAERYATHVFPDPPVSDPNIVILPVIHIERDGVDLAAQDCAGERSDVLHLRRGG